MTSMLHWCSMGGYGSYVWPAYSVVVMTLLLMFLSVRNYKKRTTNQLKQWFTD